jgi:hypothetical protein
MFSKAEDTGWAQVPGSPHQQVDVISNSSQINPQSTQWPIAIANLTALAGRLKGD